LGVDKRSKSDVIRTIEKALEVRTGSVDESTRAEDVSEWDSVGHLSILASLDKLFGGKVGQVPELASANSVEKILSELEKKSLI
jgi:acyl carrier protein